MLNVPTPSEQHPYPVWLAAAAGRAAGLRLGARLIYRAVTCSTNDDARSLAKQGAPDGLVVLADEQIHGRGRIGRSWYAPAATSLLLSVIMRPNLPLSQAAQLTMLMGLSALDAIEQVTGLRAGLKWPNDILLGELKAGGILSELEGEGDRVRWGVVGLGLNVNFDMNGCPDLAATATSLMAATGSEVNRGDLLVALLRGLSIRYSNLIQGKQPYEEWQARLATLGQQVRVESGCEVFEGLAEFVSPEGSLYVRLGDGTLREVVAGDVKLRRSGG
jgi:BirA family biotin operon repressor/biotin-[acetyl-CoA-carboxylase] ligase